MRSGYIYLTLEKSPRPGMGRISSNQLGVPVRLLRRQVVFVAQNSLSLPSAGLRLLHRREVAGAALFVNALSNLMKRSSS